MFQNNYFKQVELILLVLPEIFKSKCFALKGGTAINLFIRNMPRLSVDIDLVYLPKESREIFLQKLTIALQVLVRNIEESLKCKIQKTYNNHPYYLSKFVIHKDAVNIKVETNVVLRETILDCETRDLCQKAQDIFLHFSKANTLAFAEIYAGKICAALDRQHPRDLFDVKLLLENEGFTREICQTFVIYLASSPRPINELLGGNQLNFKSIFDYEFLGMTDVELTYKDLLDTRSKLLELIFNSLTEKERRFLLSIKLGEPEWELIDIANVKNFPALRWKLFNIRKMERSKWKQAVEDLKRILDL